MYEEMSDVHRYVYSLYLRLHVVTKTLNSRMRL